MSRKYIYIFLFVIAGLLLLGFVIRLVADYVLYNPAETSFPFYAYVIERSVEFLLPSMVCLGAPSSAYQQNTTKLCGSPDIIGDYLGLKLIIFCVREKSHDTHLRNNNFTSHLDE